MAGLTQDPGLSKREGARYNVKDVIGSGQDGYAAVMSLISRMQPYDTLYIPDGFNLAVSQELVLDKNYYNFICDGYISPYGSYSGFLISFRRPAGYTAGSNPPIGDLPNRARIEGLMLRCNGQSRGFRLWNHDLTKMDYAAVERPYGCAAQVRVLRESSLLRLEIMNGLRRQVFDPTGISAWNSGTTYNADDRVYIAYSAWGSGTTYNINDFVVGSDGIPYRSIQASNTNHNPASAANPTWWRRVPFEYYQCVVSNTNKTPETFHMNAASSSDRLWRFVHFDEAALDMDENGAGNPEGDWINSVDFLGLTIRNCDHRHYVRMDVNDTAGLIRSVSFWQPHIHYLGSNYIDNVSVPWNYGQAVQNEWRGVFLGMTDSISFVQPEFVTAEASEGAAGIQAGTKTTLKTCSRIHWDGGIANVGAPRGIAFDVMPSMTAGNENYNKINMNSSLGGASSLAVNDPTNKTWFSYIGVVEVQRLSVVNRSDSTRRCQIYAGTGSPEANVTGNIGDMYLRSNLATGLITYVKTSDATNTGWLPLNYINQGSTANRPSLSGSGFKGIIYFDTDLGSPLWHNGTEWGGGNVFTKTITAGGTTGNQTINKQAGSVNIAASGTSVTVTNSLVTTSSIILATIATNDSTAVIKNVVPGSGSFVITLNAAATAETRINWIVIN